MTEPTRKAIVVLGMHRSGTSALTRTLAFYGAALPAEMLDPGPDNQVGFWEPKSIVEIHDALLGSVGSAWDDIGEFPPQWIRSDDALLFGSRLREAFNRNYADASLIIIKDPRICRLVPLWLSVLGDLDIKPHFVIPVRNPLEVAASLMRRDGFPLQKSLLLWLRHLIDAERATRGRPRAFVAFENLLADQRQTVAAIGQEIGIAWPRSPESAAPEVEQFLSDEHRHHTIGQDTVVARADVPEWIKTAYAWAVQATLRPQPADSIVLDRLHHDFGIASRAFIPVIADCEAAISGLSATNDHLSRVRVEQARDFAERVQPRESALISTQTEMTKRIRQLETEVVDSHRQKADMRRQLEAIHTSGAYRSFTAIQSTLEQIASNAPPPARCLFEAMTALLAPPKVNRY